MALWSILVVILIQILPRLCQEGVRDDSRVDSVVRQAVADEFSSEILTNRTRAFLSCASGEMVVKLNFSEPFRGITYTDYDRTSPCRFYGDGSKHYILRIPLKGCGTRQEAPRVFVNNIIVRFHRSLQLEEDEIKTIICRYPPPLAPPPVNVVAPIVVPPPPVAAVLPPKLSEVELLLIICALLFLTLLLLGIGVAYYCLKKRNIKVIKKKKAMSSAPPSAITKLSGSTMGSLMFDPIRIPRAIAQSISGSEAALLTTVDRSDTIPSDYPSESPSSVHSEEIEGRRSTIVSETTTTKHDRYRYENTAFVPDEGSVRSGYPIDQERDESVSSVPVTTFAKPRIMTKLATEQILTTISEREDILQQESRYARTAASLPSTYVSKRPPSLYGSIPDNDNWSQSETESQAPIRQSDLLTSTVTDYLINTQDATDTQEDITRHRQTIYQRVEDDLMPRKPKITVQNIDDVFITTTTETTATEHVTKQTRDSMEQTQAPTWDLTRSLNLPDENTPHWDVLIRVLQPPSLEGVEELTMEDKEKWRTLVTTDSTFFSLVQRATTVEEYVQISRDIRYETVFSPQVWKIIIRFLTTDIILPQPVARYRKRSEGIVRRGPYQRSSSVDLDMRSVTETDVDFGRAERESLWSVDTGYTYRTGRSITERSTSEFVEDVPIYFQSRPPPPLERSSSEFVTLPDTISSVHRIRSNGFSTSEIMKSGEYSNSEYQMDANGAVFHRSNTEIIINSPLLENIKNSSSIVSKQGQGIFS